jgi:hypothetical protein
MRLLFAVSALSVVAAASASASAAPQDSWGKLGISFAQYRQDALYCGKQGYTRDISKTDDAKAFVSASKQLDAITPGAPTSTVSSSSSTGPATDNSIDQMVEYADQQQHIIDSIHPEQRFRSIKQTLLSTVDQCLTSRGYSRFRLTDGQRKQLSRLKAGSDERKHYLYSLASDPAVLQSQKEVAGQ